jgi:hypothetical protein
VLPAAAVADGAQAAAVVVLEQLGHPTPADPTNDSSVQGCRQHTHQHKLLLGQLNRCNISQHAGYAVCMSVCWRMTTAQKVSCPGFLLPVRVPHGQPPCYPTNARPLFRTERKHVGNNKWFRLTTSSSKMKKLLPVAPLLLCCPPLMLPASCRTDLGPYCQAGQASMLAARADAFMDVIST